MTMHPSSKLGKENNSSDEFEYCDRAKSVHKKTMKASELLKKNTRGRGIRSLSSIDTSDNSSTPFRGKKGSELMKYSSLSPPERRVASAKTISDLCFSRDSTESSYSPESLLLESYDDDGKFAESYVLDEEEASPNSRKIMEEMEQIYELSPIPKSYLNSRAKRSQVLPEIVLNPNSTENANATAPKRSTEASELQKQNTRRKRNQNKRGNARSRAVNGPSTTSFAATEAAYGGSKARKRNSPVSRQLSSANAFIGKSRNESDCQNRETLSAPTSSGGVPKSHEWDVPSEKPTRSVAVARKSSKKKPVALTVQREKQQRKTRLNDANSSSNEADGRRNLDKRTARLRFADAFKADIMQHRQRLAYLNNGTNHSDKLGSHIQDRGMNGVSIIVRKRPIFDYELDRGDYDVVSIDNTNESSHDVCIVHNGVMHADMKRMLMKPTSYPVTAAFDEHCSDDDIYRHVASPLVLDAANEGVATILMYGQTGCGKSHTMSGIETRTAHGLFQAIDSNFSDKNQSARPIITMQFVELCGSKEVKDLLVKRSGEVKLADDEDGSVRLLNAASHEVTTPADLLERIMLAKGRRATEATDKNGVSSRSHAVCQIQIKGHRRGVLTLIDCAGSERKHDSMYHSR